MSDEPRRDQSQRDELHTMTLRELETKFIAAGILMSRRQIMRHCESGTFEAKKLPATNNIEEWFIVPSSIERGIADIRTLQEHRARRDASRHGMTGHDRNEITSVTDVDTSRHDPSHQATSEKENIVEKGETRPVMPGHVSTDFDIFEHPYVKRLEERNEKLELKLEAQVRRTEEIQMKSQEKLLELQRMTAVGQSQTLANFMLEAKDWMLGRGGEGEKREAEASPVTHASA